MHSSPATQFTEGTHFPYPESDESSDDARRVCSVWWNEYADKYILVQRHHHSQKVAARHINPNRRLRRFDSADYYVSVSLYSFMAKTSLVQTQCHVCHVLLSDSFRPSSLLMSNNTPTLNPFGTCSRSVHKDRECPAVHAWMPGARSVW